MSRLLLLVALACTLLGTAGCLNGPQNNRLYTSEWKAKKSRPIKIEKSFEYEGEHWERVEVVEESQ